MEFLNTKKRFTSLTIIAKLFLLMTTAAFINCSNSLNILFEDPLRNSLLPVISMINVSIESDNTDPTVSDVGDTITLTFTADESINTPSVTIMGYSVTPVGGPDTFSATYVVKSGDPIGIVPFTISEITGLSGDIGADVSSTTDFSSVHNGLNPPAWELEVTTTAPSQSMTIGLNAPVRIVIDWGDGNSELTTETSVTHTYAATGVYTLKIRGHSSRIHFNYFNATQRLTRILSVVKGITGITSFLGTFFNCSKIAGSIPAGLFDNTPLVTTFESTFSDCSNLTGPIPAGLFDKTPLVTTFRNTFFQCFNLPGPIPAELFDNNTQVTTFDGTFQNCRNLTSIPAGLFKNNTLVTSFIGTFANCYDITSIPSGLFNNNTRVTTFAWTFYACEEITSVPAGLFDKNTLVTTFNSTFFSCNGITSIPAGLFDKNTRVTTFESTFSGCSSLTSIPSGLFIKNTLVTNFSWTFSNCISLSGPAPDLWNTHPAADIPPPDSNYCFRNAASLTNWASIPDNWKN